MCIHPRYGWAEEIPGAILALLGVLYMFGPPNSVFGIKRQI